MVNRNELDFSSFIPCHSPGNVLARAASVPLSIIRQTAIDDDRRSVKSLFLLKKFTITCQNSNNLSRKGRMCWLSLSSKCFELLKLTEERKINLSFRLIVLQT